MKSAPSHIDASTLLSSTRILLFALSAGVLVASLYYVQPLTSMLAASFGVSVPQAGYLVTACLLYTSPSPRDATLSRMPSSA